MQDQVGAEAVDGLREKVAAEKRKDLWWLPVQGFADRRVVKEYENQVCTVETL